MAHEIWTWNESDLGKLTKSDLKARQATLHVGFSMPSAETLAKLARWGKACALWELRRQPTYSAAKPAVARAMSKLYEGMDGFRLALLTMGTPVPNDETLASTNHEIGRRMGHGLDAQAAFTGVLAEYHANPAPYLRLEGGKPFDDMANFDTLHRP